MSREIKFRAWVKPLKRYANGIDTILYHKACDVEGGGIWSVVCEEWDSEVYECDNIVIEQYTGLKDKNGKEIYEGDIIRVHLSPISSIIFEGMVEYKPGCFMFKCFADSGSYAFNCLGLVEAVIGNIHENPELLGGEE